MDVLYKYIIIVNLLLAFKICWDSYAKKVQKRIINHWRSGIIDSILYLIFSYLLFKPNWFTIIGFIFLSWSYRWIFFDAIFGKLHWNDWHYHGTSDFLDRWLMKIGKYHFFIKFIPVIIGTVLIWISTL